MALICQPVSHARTSDVHRNCSRLLAGALVTNTDSGRGCGDDFPLCNGKFIPAYTVESLIEYSHRLISGLVGLLVLATFIVTLVFYRRYREAVVHAACAGFFTVLQAVLGAIAVVWPQSSAVLALHFGIWILALQVHCSCCCGRIG